MFIAMIRRGGRVLAFKAANLHLDNILLDDNFEPHLTRHCLVQLFPERLRFDSFFDRNAFCNPETPESDIFAFGVLLDVARRCPDPNSLCRNLIPLSNAILRNGVCL
jgi:hypothetical protein